MVVQLKLIEKSLLIGNMLTVVFGNKMEVVVIKIKNGVVEFLRCKDVKEACVAD
jgi:hypothetical protein